MEDHVVQDIISSLFHNDDDDDDSNGVAYSNCLIPDELEQRMKDAFGTNDDVNVNNENGNDGHGSSTSSSSSSSNNNDTEDDSDQWFSSRNNLKQSIQSALEDYDSNESRKCWKACSAYCIWLNTPGSISYETKSMEAFRLLLRRIREFAFDIFINSQKVKKISKRKRKDKSNDSDDEGSDDEESEFATKLSNRKVAGKRKLKKANRNVEDEDENGEGKKKTKNRKGVSKSKKNLGTQNEENDNNSADDLSSVDMNDDFEDDSPSNGLHFKQQLETFIRFIPHLVKATMLSNFVKELRIIDELFIESIETLVVLGKSAVAYEKVDSLAISIVELDQIPQSKPTRKKSSNTQNLSVIVSNILIHFSLCQLNGSYHNESIRMILKHLLPVFLGSDSDAKSYKLSLQSWSLSTITKILHPFTDVTEETLEDRNYALAFFEHAAVSAPDRAEPRLFLVQALIQFTMDCVIENQTVTTRIVKFLNKLIRSAKSPHRIFAVEFSSSLLCQFFSYPSLKENQSKCIEILNLGSNDKLPTVRVGAIKGLGSFLEVVTSSKANKDSNEVSIESSTEGDIDFSSFGAETIKSLKLAAADDKPVVRRAAMKAIVLLVAYGASSCKLEAYEFCKIFSDCLFKRIDDTSSAVRKHSLEGVSEMVYGISKRNNIHEKESENVILLFSQKALCLANDSEKSVSTTVFDLIDKHIINPLVLDTKGKSNNLSELNGYIKTSLKIVSLISQESLAAFELGLLNLVMDGKVKVENLVKSLLQLIKVIENQQIYDPSLIRSCWQLIDFLCCGPTSKMPGISDNMLSSLDDLTLSYGNESNSNSGAKAIEQTSLGSVVSKLRLKSIQAVDSHFVLQKLKDFKNENAATVEQFEEQNIRERFVLRVVAATASKFNTEDLTEIHEYIFKQKLATLSCTPSIGHASLRALVALSRYQSETMDQFKSSVNKWGTELLKIYENELNKSVIRVIKNGSKVQKTLMSQVGLALFLVGEISILGVDMSASGSADTFAKSGKSSSLGLISISNDIEAIAVYLATGFENTDSIIASETQTISAVFIDSAIRAHAFITLGKLCLRDPRLAKRIVPVMGKQLSERRITSDPVVKANILLVLGDLCRKYTSLVDPHLEHIAKCLSDPSQFVRHRCLLFFLGLLQEDYIKWRPSLFYRIMICCVDGNAEISELAKYALLNIFLKKTPGLFMSHFIESIFVFTGYVGHTRYNRNSYLGNGAGVIENMMVNDLMKEEQRNIRMKIYKMMLTTMDESQKIEITQFICKYILGGILDGFIPLSKVNEPNQTTKPQTDRLFGDAIAILQLDEISIDTKGSGNENQNSDDENDEDQMDIEANTENNNPNKKEAIEAIQAAKKKMLSNFQRKAALESIVPLAISLYRMFQREKCGMIRFVTTYLQKLFKTYKEDLKDVLVAERDIVIEIEQSNQTS